MEGVWVKFLIREKKEEGDLFVKQKKKMMHGDGGNDIYNENE